MFDKLDEVVKRYRRLTEKLADSTIYDRKDDFRSVTEERSALEEIVSVYTQYKKIQEDTCELREILREENDREMKVFAKEELSKNILEITLLEKQLTLLLLPKDPLDDKNVMIEIRSAAGGDEASLFVSDIYRMYQNYLNNLGFKQELISISAGEEGIKEVIFSIMGDKVYSKFKFESGVHRVQRVPKTESQGRVHTSTITVAVMPEADEIEFNLDLNDIRIDVYRSGGAGGQSVNTTDSAVRITHLPTGIVVTNQDQKSQHKNKEKALRILKARIFDQMLQKHNASEAEKRRGMVGKGDRSERIRTYNFPQGRLSDHRINLTLYSLDKILEGDLSPVTDALINYNQTRSLKGKDD